MWFVWVGTNAGSTASVDGDTLGIAEQIAAGDHDAIARLQAGDDLDFAQAGDAQAHRARYLVEPMLNEADLVLAMTREIAVMYARRGIRANALCPGPIMTPLLAKFLSDDAKRQRRLVHVPMGRFGEPHEIAQGAVFLASDESSWMTGQSLVIDGGITAAYVTPE